MASLNAEAPLPHERLRRLNGFDLGAGSSRFLFTQRSELNDKITASLTWLELIERTGLLPRTNNVSFFVEQMLQAAWWSRFADTPQRSIGLLLRSHRENALAARDISLPPHRSGWLGRYEVACFNAPAAAELCVELMRLIFAEIKEAGTPARNHSRAKFLLEIFSRIVMRIQNDALLQQWGMQLLELYRATAVRTAKLLWDPLSKALTRILEALPNSLQFPIILHAWKTIQAYSEPDSGQEFFRWLNFNILFKNWDPDVTERASPQWRQIAQTLIQQLRSRPELRPSPHTWHQLVALHEKGILNHQEQREVSTILWESPTVEHWPVIPGCYPAATLFWPLPRQKSTTKLLNILLEKPLRPFNSGSYMHITLGDGKRSYQLGGVESSLGTIYHTTNTATLKQPQIIKIIDLITEWLDTQLDELVLDFDNDHLHGEIIKAIGYLDIIFAKCVTVLAERPKSASIHALIARIAKLDDRLQDLSFPRHHLKLSLILIGQQSIKALDDLARALIRAIANDAEPHQLAAAAGAAYALLKEDDSRLKSAAKMVFDAIASCVLSQRTSRTGQLMRILANLPPTVWNRNLDQNSLTLLDVALEGFSDSLSYNRQGSPDAELDDLLPDLRFWAFGLAYALIYSANAHSPAAQRWLDVAGNDPLPEVRLGRFKRQIEN